jgi:hypothetical protein
MRRTNLDVTDIPRKSKIWRPSLDAILRETLWAPTRWRSNETFVCNDVTPGEQSELVQLLNTCQDRQSMRPPLGIVTNSI